MAVITKDVPETNIPEFAATDVEAVYRASGLRCIGPIAFAKWYSAEAYYEGTMSRKPSLWAFCDDGQGCPEFCQTERAVGRCRKADPEPMPTEFLPLPAGLTIKRPTSRVYDWLVSYLKSRGGSAFRDDIIEAAALADISSSALRHAAVRHDDIDRGVDTGKTSRIWRLL